MEDTEENTTPQEKTASRESKAESSSRARHPMEVLLRNVAGSGFIKFGDLVEGTVLEKKGARLFVDLGNYGIGVVYGREYQAAQDIIKNLTAGERISAKVVDTDNEEGYVELSLREAGAEKSWSELKRMAAEGEVMELAVLEANRGGLILEAKNIRGFLPASQLSTKNYPRVDGGDKEKIYQELQKLVGQKLTVKILDLNPAEQKLIFTERGRDSEGVRTSLAKYKVGDEVEGEITGVVDFGAFMRFDQEAGLEGLVHVSEIDWSLVEDPRTILKPGERRKAKIIDIQGDRVSLSLKQLKEDPWSKLPEKYKKGDLVMGKVTKFNPFGAFVEIEPAIQGLVHISEFGTETKMRSALEVGKEYQFKVLLLDTKEHRMSLGMVGEDKKEGELT